MARMAYLSGLVAIVAIASPQISSAAARPQDSSTCGDASVETSGLATAGTTGLVRLEMSGAPQVHGPFHLQVAGALPHASGALVVTSLGAPIDFPFEQPEALVVHPFVVRRNGTSPPLLRQGKVPDSLCGVTLDVQGLVFDAGASGGIASTKAARIVFGGPAEGPLFPTLAVEFEGAPNDVVSADLNADGIADCVVTLSGSAAEADVTILLGVGDGRFDAHASYAYSSGSADGLVLDDFDGDLVLDVAFALDGSAASSIEILRGLGDGSFVPYASVPWAGGNPRSIARGDLDGDGDLDLVVNDTTSKVVGVELSNGDGTFTDGQMLTFPGTPFPAAPREVTLADLDGDQVLDLAVAIVAFEQVVHFGAGDGTFLPAGPFLLGPGAASSVAVGDFDGNQIPDLVFGVDDAVEVYLGAGGGSFATALHVPTGPDESDTTGDLVVADIDLDGAQDILAVNANDDRVFVLAGQGDGSFVLDGDYSVGNNPVAAAVDFFDADAAMDVVVVNTIDQTMNVFLGRGDGTLIANVDTPVPGSVSSTAARFALGDVNGDQVLDLAMKRATSSVSQQDQMLVWFGAPDGTFALQQTLSSGGRGGGTVAIVDLNGDLASDVLLLNQFATNTSPFGSTLAFFENQGAGTFGSPSITDLGETNWTQFELADLDGDGVLDVVALHQFGSFDTTGEYGVLLGQGGGAFGPPAIFPIGHVPTDVTIADIDRDHVLDVVIAGAKEDGFGTASLLLGVSDGSFQAPQAIDIGPIIVGSSGDITLEAVDLDGDKALDLVLVLDIAAPQSLSLVHGNGDGTFAAAQTSGVINGPLIAIRDMDADELLDIVVDGHLATQGPAVSFRQRDGTFAPHVRFHGTADSVADVDGDLLPDLVGLTGFPPQITFMPGLLLP